MGGPEEASADGTSRGGEGVQGVAGDLEEGVEGCRGSEAQGSPGSSALFRRIGVEQVL